MQRLIMSEVMSPNPHMAWCLMSDVQGEVHLFCFDEMNDGKNSLLPTKTTVLNKKRGGGLKENLNTVGFMAFLLA
jgi:hypothetical protein